MIKLLCMDVDGTLTDGKIYFGGQGEVFKAFNVKDGYSIAHIMPYKGVTPIIITGRKSDIVERRARDLKIERVYQGISNKLEKLAEVAEEMGITFEEIAYIGDDVNDLDCIDRCGFTGCPRDALPDVLRAVDFISSYDGGNGAVREFCDKILEINESESK